MAATPAESCQFVALRCLLGSLRVGTIDVQAPTPHTPPLQAFLVDFSQHTMAFGHLWAWFASGALEEH